MPKSKLRSSISIDEVDSIQATREKVSVESITVNNRLVKRPKFLRAQISPRFRAVGSIETDEVEYDTYVKWVISQVSPIAFTDIVPPGTGHGVDENGNINSVFGCGLHEILPDMNGWEEVEMSTGTIWYNYYFPSTTGYATLQPSFDINSPWGVTGDLSIAMQDVYRTGYITPSTYWYLGVGDPLNEFLGLKLELIIGSDKSVTFKSYIAVVEGGSESTLLIKSIDITPLIQSDGSVPPISGSIGIAFDGVDPVGNCSYYIVATIDGVTSDLGKDFTSPQSVTLKAMSDGINFFACYVNWTDISLVSPEEIEYGSESEGGGESEG